MSNMRTIVLLIVALFATILQNVISNRLGMKRCAFTGRSSQVTCHGYTGSFVGGWQASTRGVEHRTRRNIMEMQAEGENIYTGVPSVAAYADVNFAIMGGGAFSLALAKVLSYKNINTSLLVRDQAVADHINTERYHPKYLTESKVPDCMTATSDPVVGKFRLLLFSTAIAAPPHDHTHEMYLMHYTSSVFSMCSFEERALCSARCSHAAITCIFKLCEGAHPSKCPSSKCNKGRRTRDILSHERYHSRNTR